MELEIGTELYCIKSRGFIEEGKTYRIKGCGDLTLLHGTRKTGFGFSIEVERYDKRFYDWWNHRLPIKLYYFTAKEADIHFCDSNLTEKQIARHKKISTLV
jgi:hypothetical protein